MAKTQKQAQTGGDKVAKMQYEVLRQYKEALDQGKPARSVQFESVDEQKFARDLFLLTNKPVLYVCNVDEASAVTGNAHTDAVRAAIADEHAEMLIVAASAEADIAELDDPDEKAMFMEELGLKQSGLDRLIQCSYELLGLISFLTAGSDECRAWTIKKGTKAPQAAGKIHSDFERGFIRAEVIAFDDLKACGTLANAKAKGLLRSEGKEYVMHDGDVVNFLFNV